MITGIGEKTSDALRKAHICSLFDLLLRVPKAIVTQEENPGFSYMEAGRHYVAKALVFASKTSGLGTKRRLEVILQDQTGKISAIFFGPAVSYAQKILKTDTTVVFSGVAKNFLGKIQMVHPKLLTSDSPIESN